MPTMVSISGKPCVVVFGNDKKKLKHLSHSIDSLSRFLSFESDPFSCFDKEALSNKKESKDYKKCKKRSKKQSINRSRLSKKEIRKIKKIIKKTYKNPPRDSKKSKKVKKFKKQKISNKDIKKISKQVLRYMRLQMFDHMIYANTEKAVSHYLSQDKEAASLASLNTPVYYPFETNEILDNRSDALDGGSNIFSSPSLSTLQSSDNGSEHVVISPVDLSQHERVEPIADVHHAHTHTAAHSSRPVRKKNNTTRRAISKKANKASAHNMYPQKLYKKKPELDSSRISKIHEMHRQTTRVDASKKSANLNKPKASNVQNAPFPDASKNERKVLEYLSTHPQATQSELSNVLLVSRSSIADYTSSLQLKGYLRREGTRREGRWVVVGLEA